MQWLVQALLRALGQEPERWLLRGLGWMLFWALVQRLLRRLGRRLDMGPAQALVQ